MTPADNILITGAAGFIGSCLVSYLNREGYDNLILADDFNRENKKPNLAFKRFLFQVPRDDLFTWLNDTHTRLDGIFHMGARTDTTDPDYEVFRKLNLDYSKKIWSLASSRKLPLVYASTAATYGKGEQGYLDDPKLLERMQPLNPYGVSKHEFDRWVLEQPRHPPYWYGLKFFNVYGPNEYHKGRMASVLFHAYNQIRDSGRVSLFASYNPQYQDGEQLRDFIYVLDIVRVCHWLMESRPAPGIYNLGTGQARTFLDLARAVFLAMGPEPAIDFIPMPGDIREKYQYFTEARMEKLRRAGYGDPFYSLEDGVRDYLTRFLVPGNYY